MTIAVQSEKLRELVDENAEVEQIATGFTFTEGPIWMRRVAPLQRHAERQPPPVDPKKASRCCATRATSATA